MSSSSAARIQKLSLRSPSPSANAFASAAIGGTSGKRLIQSTSHAISTATSIRDLCETIPSRYRELLPPVLHKAMDTHGKYLAASKFLASLENHSQNKTWPTSIAGMHNPFASVQCSKESTSIISPLLAESTTWFNLQKEEALARTIKVKKAEVEHLENLCSLPSIEKQLLKALDDDWKALEKAVGSKVEGPPELTIRDVPDIFKDEIALAKDLCPFWAAKAWDFMRIKSQRHARELEAKREKVADATTTPMDIDSGPSTQTIRDVIREELRHQKRADKPRNPGNKGKGNTPKKRLSGSGQQARSKPKGIGANKGVQKRKRIVSNPKTGPAAKKGKKN